MASPNILSASDSITLTRLFDPESSPSAVATPINTSLPPDPHYPLELLPRLQEAEREAISDAETSPENAFTALSSIISEYPSYASAYNNRAQLRRLLKHPHEAVLSDLDAAVRYAQGTSPSAGVSEHQARVLRNAYSQRGAVYLDLGLEEDAAKEMEVAARFGSDVAKRWMVQRNPYARLCGMIVKEVMMKEVGAGAG